MRRIKFLKMQVYFEYYQRCLIRFIKLAELYNQVFGIDVNRLHIRYEMWGGLATCTEPPAACW